MVIAAHIGGKELEKSLLLSALKKTATLQPHNKFVFFTNSPLDHLLQNCTQATIYPRPTNKVLLYYWYNYKLPKLIQKYNIDAFISNAGMLAAGTSITQYLFFENKDLLEEKNSIFKKRLTNAIAIAQSIFVTDGVISNALNTQFPIYLEKTQNLRFSLPGDKKIFTFDDIEGVRNKYTDGYDYYLFRVDDASKGYIVTVLKSFSQLKKWQKTSLKLILFFENDIDEKLLPHFKNYKYRNDVILLKETNENKSILIAAAFSFIYFSDYKRSKEVYTALQYNIPVIAADTETNKLLFKLNVAYTANSIDDLALQLQLIYKDEVYRKQLLQNSTIDLTKFDTQKASQKFAEIISN